jgi:hypothetical protein
MRALLALASLKHSEIVLIGSDVAGADELVIKGRPPTAPFSIMELTKSRCATGRQTQTRTHFGFGSRSVSPNTDATN